MSNPPRDSDKVSNNATSIIIVIVISAAGVTVIGLFAPNALLMKEVLTAFIGGIIGFGAGIVSALWVKR